MEEKISLSVIVITLVSAYDLRNFLNDRGLHTCVHFADRECRSWLDRGALRFPRRK